VPTLDELRRTLGVTRDEPDEASTFTIRGLAPRR